MTDTLTRESMHWNTFDLPPKPDQLVDIYVSGWFFNADGQKQIGASYRIPLVYCKLNGYTDMNGNPIEWEQDYGMNTAQINVTHWMEVKAP